MISDMELTAEEAESDVAAHQLHLVGHGLVHIPGALKLLGVEAVDQAGDGKEERTERESGWTAGGI